jgi:hypothetical protein
MLRDAAPLLYLLICLPYSCKLGGPGKIIRCSICTLTEDALQVKRAPAQLQPFRPRSPLTLAWERPDLPATASFAERIVTCANRRKHAAIEEPQDSTFIHYTLTFIHLARLFRLIQ